MGNTLGGGTHWLSRGAGWIWRGMLFCILAFGYVGYIHHPGGQPSVLGSGSVIVIVCMISIIFTIFVFGSKDEIGHIATRIIRRDEYRHTDPVNPFAQSYLLWSMGEGIALFGLVFALAGAPIWVAMSFVLWGFCVVLLCPPTLGGPATASV